MVVDKGCVLVVEDNDDVRTFAQQILTETTQIAKQKFDEVA